MNSAPAHVSYPTVHIKLEGEAEEGVVIVKDENKVELGTLEDSNHRIINKYIVTGQVEKLSAGDGTDKNFFREAYGIQCHLIHMTDVWKYICILIFPRMHL